MKSIECIKCGGSGYIQRYAGIAAGRCFECAGKGNKQVANNYQPTELFVVKGLIVKNPDLVLNAEVGTIGVIYNVKAKTETEALNKARELWSKAPSNFRVCWASFETWTATKR
jgi:hypothetical protein